MDSPDVNTEVLEHSNQVSIIKETDDSGYVTVTPSSAECTRLLSDISVNSSSRTPFRLKILSDSLHNTSALPIGSTPEGTLFTKKSNLPMKLLFSHDSFTEGSSSIEDSFCNEKLLPTVHEGDTLDVKSTGHPSLKRQLAVDDDMEWGGEGREEKNMCETTPPMVLEGKQITSEDKIYARPFFQRCTASDPRDYNKSLMFMNSLDLNTPSVQQNIAPDSKYTCTPVKGPRKLRRSSSKEPVSARSSRTPEKHDCSTSDCHSSDSKFVKKLLFETQKLGSPEKNKLLYPDLKPVTPPKKIKLTKPMSPKCRKRLQMKTQNYIGREHVDFLKMLGEVQSHRPAIKRILNYLSGDDLINVCKVSKCWENVCRSEKDAEMRRYKTMRENERVKENRNVLCRIASVRGKEKILVPSHHNVGMRRRDHLSEIQNHSNIMSMPVPKVRSPPVSPRRRRFNMFAKAASEDSSSQLRKCPRCQRPARVRDQWAVCGGHSCGYSFCARCLTERGASGQCCQRALEAPSPSKQVQIRDGICSKKSKRNLKRLLM